MAADVNSAFDVAFWFADTALAENEYLQPQKLQRLLFIAQAYYAVAFPKRKLMPALFVADELGPVEPNVFLAFSRGRPDVDVELFLPHDVDTFLSSIWRRFGHYEMERLNELTNETLAYKQARDRAHRAEITIEAMRLSFVRGETAPAVEQVMAPKIMRTQSGKQVIVQSWSPGDKKAKP
ncbi:MAG: hypothetical protein HN644_03545 [Rhodospirillales bacterium]|jgi:uncharacterized phage-associated protein|nr:hypothetical protein [Rhodospirillales bacterium]MBT4038631.1 hypothetical protein [Rhodospirillales bacterium]MBT4627609.1 hypothetical protein [Rhodospirillales bacterium]MBT5350645.1 hypothetical protein [Rhodospirillales bacterium]MBT5521502.1 hypothetical protein [Rhodospirillales bacterium]